MSKIAYCDIETSRGKKTHMQFEDGTILCPSGNKTDPAKRSFEGDKTGAYDICASCSKVAERDGHEIVDQFEQPENEPENEPEKAQKSTRKYASKSDWATNKLQKFVDFLEDKEDWFPREIGSFMEENEQGDKQTVTFLTVDGPEGIEMTLTFVDAYFIAGRSKFNGRDHLFGMRNVSAARKLVENPPTWANACDSRCTSAKSDKGSCSCDCGGENHGVDLLIQKEDNAAKREAANA